MDSAILLSHNRQLFIIVTFSPWKICFLSKTTRKEEVVFSGLLPGMLVKSTVKQVSRVCFLWRRGGGGLIGTVLISYAHYPQWFLSTACNKFFPTSGKLARHCGDVSWWF